MGKRIRLSGTDKERVDNILISVEKENDSIRGALVKKLPAYVKLKSLHAKSFNEFALMSICREENLDYTDPLFDYSIIKPYCPACHKKDYVIKRGDRYFCKNCNKSFYANHNSISSGSKVDAATWLQVLMCLLENKTIDETCKICEIETHTYYNIRTRLFYAMKLMLEDVKLYGKVEVDTTFTRVSYKGSNLTDEEYPEDSPFFDESNRFIPREARERGGRNPKSQQFFNQNCIIAFRDSFGHCRTIYLCIGTASLGVLKEKINTNMFLDSVPAIDPFEFTKKKINHKKQSGEKSIYISDNELALIKFGETTGLLTEHHVYRRNGVQVKLPKGANNIQRVNNIHRKLKTFLRKCNYISSRHLPGFLYFFDFVQVSGASDLAIQRLFQIISTPGLGKPPEFFNKLFITPNYLINSNNPQKPLEKYPKNYLIGAYLYHQKVTKEIKIKINDIENRTGCSREIIRRTYKNICAMGLIDDLNKSYKLKGLGNNEFEISVPKKRYGFYCSPIMLSIFDEYCVNRCLPDEERMTQSEFVDYVNEKYGLSLKFYNIRNRIDSIVKWGIRPPLGRMPRDSNYTKRNTSKKEEMYPYVKEALELRDEQKRNATFKSKLDICTTIEKKHGLSPMKLYKHMQYMQYW